MLKFRSMMSLVLALCMTFSLSSAAFAEDDEEWDEDSIYSGDCGNSVAYDFDNESGILTISGEGEMENYDEDDTVPWFDFCADIKGLNVESGVTLVSDYSFLVCENLTEVKLADTVTSIGNYAFSSCSKLETITLSQNLTKIGKGAFSSCEAIKEISIPGGVTNIEEEAFACCSSLSTLTLPSGLTKISEIAFVDCSALTSLIIPEGVTSIAEGAFDSCEGIKTVFVPQSLKTVEEGVFNGCKSIKLVYYGGSKSQWKKISIADGNTELTDAKRSYGIAEEEVPDPVLDPDDDNDDPTVDPGTGKTDTPNGDDDDEKYDDDDVVPSVSGKTVIKLSKSSAKVYLKKKYQIKVKITRGIGKTTFKSSNKKICKVTAKGVVTALKKGTAKITVKNNGVSKVFTVKVINPKLNKSSIKLKTKTTFTVKITGKVGKASYSSNNKNVAAVSKNGKITAKKKGTAYITVKTNGIKLKLKVKVI